MVITEGHRDALEMGKEIRYDLYDLFLEAPPTLAPRHLRRTVAERMSPEGDVLLPFDEAAFRDAVRSLVEAQRVSRDAAIFSLKFSTGAVLSDRIAFLSRIALASSLAGEEGTRRRRRDPSLVRRIGAHSS